MTCLMAAVYGLVTRSVTARNSAIFIAVAGLFVATLSGWLKVLLPFAAPGMLRFLRIVTGPLAGAVAAGMLLLFLRASQRDAIVQRGLRTVVVMCAALMLVLVLPEAAPALQIVAWGMMLCAAISAWLAFRAALLGDKLAWVMAAACVCMLLAVMGLYGSALGIWGHHVMLQLATAITACIYLALCGIAVWQRNLDFVQMRRALRHDTDRDLLTQLLTGSALARQVDAMIARARRNRKETAIVCVEVFNIADLRKEHGAHAVDELVYTVAARVRQTAGSVIDVGRYTDTSFVVIVDSLKNPVMLRSLGLRLAVAARRPYLLRPYSSDPREFRADIGVGVARVPASRERRDRAQSHNTTFGADSLGLAQEALHEAAQLATRARTFASRAAIVDGYSRKFIPLENADFKG